MYNKAATHVSIIAVFAKNVNNFPRFFWKNEIFAPFCKLKHTSSTRIAIRAHRAHPIKQRSPSLLSRNLFCRFLFAIFFQKAIDKSENACYNINVRKTAPWPSGKAQVCKTSTPRFKSGWRLQKIPKASAFGIFLSKPQAWYIITTQSWISSAPAGLYLITRQRVFSCGLMIYNASHWWYAIPCGIDDIHAFGVIGMRRCEMLLN